MECKNVAFTSNQEVCDDNSLSIDDHIHHIALSDNKSNKNQLENLPKNNFKMDPIIHDINPIKYDGLPSSAFLAEHVIGKFDFRLMSNHVDFGGIAENQLERPLLVTPGEVLAPEQSLMRGHGTYIQSNKICSSLAGTVERTNMLISVRSLKSRYFGEIGDVVVGRIKSIHKTRWFVDVNAHLNAVLTLNALNLPYGDLRHRIEEDEEKMRDLLKENDLISAEVQNIQENGTLNLCTRSSLYGKLGQGIYLKVSPGLVQRRKTHFHTFAFGVKIILGTNGYIWIYPGSQSNDELTENGFKLNSTKVSHSERVAMVRVRNIILTLAKAKITVSEKSIIFAYEEGLKYSSKDLLQQEVCYEIALYTQNRLKEMEDL